MRRLILLQYLLVVLVTTGCAQDRIVEELGFIHSIGYDLNEAENAKKEGVLIITAAFPQVAPTAKSDREMLTTVAHTSKEGKAIMARKTERILVSGQLRTALFSNQLAEIGILDTIDTLKRDHTIGLNVKIITVNGSTKELLFDEYPNHPRTDRYIYELIEKDAQTHVTVDTSLYHFLRDYHDDGIDPITPYIKQGSDEIIIDGIALYKGDRFVYNLDPKASRVFKMLHGEYLGGDITTEIDLQNEEKKDYLYITFSTLESSRKVNVQSPSQITINIEVKGDIEEYTGQLELSDDEVQKEIERKLAKFIEKSSEKIIEIMQEHHIDNLGIGQYVRNSCNYKEWKEMNWSEEVYPEAEINVNVIAKLKGFGSVK
ncbi:hypothetical protein BKP37_16150 [Anaerobacillus alkalilacustris]|uniref:Uncharacterized protein n=1 Tax=Anaerobacillus alkalilacustris TaxID=393763 RepID=A0A1S2LHK0_9BACI|nr:Ger(x)C family spore germination protein [Anaerobacillus alkalilacustris]OIJ11187.1 hypothetical protein BKP37_16150 [Anaerobacillus alkalilacustris]